MTIDKHVREVDGEWKVVLVLAGMNGYGAPDLTVQEAPDIVQAASMPPTGFSSSRVYNTPRWGNRNELLGIDVWLDRVHVDPADIERLRDMLARPAEKPSPEPIVTAWSD